MTVTYYTGTPTGNTTPGTGFVYGFPIILSESGVVKKIGIEWANTNTGNVRVGFYSAGASKPGSLLTESASTAMATVTGFQDVTVTDYSAASGTYWVTYQGDSASKQCKFRAASRSYYSKTYGAFDATWSAGSTQDSSNQFSMSVTLPDTTVLATVTDSGSGTDSIVGIERKVTDSGAGTEALTIGAQPTFTDSGVGSESPSISATVSVVDSGIGTDLNTAQAAPLFTDSGMGIDIAYRVQGEISIDGISLPHVLEINIVDKTNLDTRPVTGDLPRREWLGNAGRTVTVSGWTRSLTDVDQLKTFCDGQTHVLILPSGDGLRVLIRSAHPVRASEDYDQVPYALTCIEKVD